MEAAIGRERATIDRLHAELAVMAQLIARAKITAQPGAVKPATLDIAALLDEFEQRVDVMLEIGGRSRRKDAPAQDHARATARAAQAPAVAAPAQPSPPDPQGVPTVSGVVSRLARASDAPCSEAGSPAAAEAGRSNVSIMEAMVQALSALDAENQRAIPAAASMPQSEPKPRRPIMPDNELVIGRTPVKTVSIPSPETGMTAEPHPDPAASARNTSGQGQSAQRPDPLAPINALSAEEKIALFS
jgi:hypothetical protein